MALDSTAVLTAIIIPFDHHLLLKPAIITAIFLMQVTFLRCLHQEPKPAKNVPNVIVQNVIEWLLLTVIHTLVLLT